MCLRKHFACGKFRISKLFGKKNKAYPKELYIGSNDTKASSNKYLIVSLNAIVS